MDVVADASAFLSVVLNEAGRDWILERTAGCGLVAPEVLPYEVGNALVAVRRRRRLADAAVLQALASSRQIPVRLVTVSVPAAVRIALEHGVYAYDAYYLQCCVENRLPLLSLDEKMCALARRLKLQVME